MASTFGADLRARLFGEYNDLSFLVSGLRIPVSLGDLIQRIESISACRVERTGLVAYFPSRAFRFTTRVMMGADGLPPTVSRREQFLSGPDNQTLLAVSREPPTIPAGCR
jgi:hypothetical protein